jgi:hypothetical protein
VFLNFFFFFFFCVCLDRDLRSFADYFAALSIGGIPYFTKKYKKQQEKLKYIRKLAVQCAVKHLYYKFKRAKHHFHRKSIHNTYKRFVNIISLLSKYNINLYETDELDWVKDILNKIYENEDNEAGGGDGACGGSDGACSGSDTTVEDDEQDYGGSGGYGGAGGCASAGFGMDGSGDAGKQKAVTTDYGDDVAGGNNVTTDYGAGGNTVGTVCLRLRGGGGGKQKPIIKLTLKQYNKLQTDYHLAYKNDKVRPKTQELKDIWTRCGREEGYYEDIMSQLASIIEKNGDKKKKKQSSLQTFWSQQKIKKVKRKFSNISVNINHNNNKIKNNKPNKIKNTNSNSNNNNSNNNNSNNNNIIK